MKISLNWLRQYLDTGETKEKIAEHLTNIGLEVEGESEWSSHPGALEGLVTGLVLSAEQHPNADKLKLTKVDIGGEEVLTIVCGAPNVAAGQKVVVATVGTKLYPVSGDPFVIKKSKIRGEASVGMICAEDEIGVGISHDGIIVLPDSTAIGQGAASIFNVEQDHILEIGLTANRSDANSHIGTARDLAAALSANTEQNYLVQRPDLSAFEIHNNDLEFDVSVENAEACPRYSGLTISGVKIGPSPEWLKNRLEAIGIKSISNVVDVTNYVLHEYGQPLHAFDADQIKSRKIVVKTMPADSAFITLDGDERKLKDTDLMITDGNSGLCIAGVYGGQGSGVTDQTVNLFLESAHFNPLYIRRTSTTHNLRTDAASHFEKGTDPNMTADALKRAALLIIETAGGKVSSKITDIYPEQVMPWSITLRFKKLNQLIGEELPQQVVKDILTAMGIEIESANSEVLQLLVPTYKTDVLRETDIIEEVLRVYGMDRIKLPNFLRSNIVFDRGNSEQVRMNVSEFLSGLGYSELFTNAITKSDYIIKLLPDSVNKAVFLENSLNSELDVMRPSMLFGGLESVAYNRNHKQQDLRFYEFGRVFELDEKGEGFSETDHLALFLCGKAAPESWNSESDNTSFFDLKTTLLQLMERIGAAVQSASKTTHPLLSCGQDLKAFGQHAASFGAISSAALEALGVKLRTGESLFYAELNWSLLTKRTAKLKAKYQAVTKFPAVRRDLALVLDKQTDFAQVEAIAKAKGGKLLQDIVLFDVYEGKNLGEEKKSYGIGLFFQDQNRTLTDKQVDKVINQLIGAYESELKATIRR
ncbi:MAG: phenylalanyl-tRNA synthetase beta chain [Limisphaerales bacterium]|jgi:phenylalanyl-tRNA synthetase beta chain